VVMVVAASAVPVGQGRHLVPIFVMLSFAILQEEMVVG